MRIIVCGCGKYYRNYKNYIFKHEVIAIVDNNKEIQGKYVDGVEVISPDHLDNYDYEKIYICTLNSNELMNQLINLGVPKEKIFFFWDFEQEKGDFFFWKNTNNGSKEVGEIALISHNFSVTGAPNCLLKMVELLAKERYHLIVASPYDGEMRNLFYEVGADIYVDRRLRMGSISTIEWLQSCELIIVNTVQLYYLLRKRNTDIPVVWWLHEPSLFYTCVNKETLSVIDKENLFIYSVSKIADDAFGNCEANIIPKRLLYGIKDEKRKNIEREKGKVIQFVVIGAVSSLKGHDILVEAAKMLSDNSNESYSVVCIGDADTKYAENLKIICEKEQLPIIFMGAVNHKEALDILEQSDVLICSSRVESMSVAITEALMLEKIVICSSNTGNVQYLADNNSCFIFESENAKSLCDKMKYVIENSDQLESVQREGRKVYENYFREDIFDKNCRELIKKVRKR